jgi:hypothetical protein
MKLMARSALPALLLVVVAACSPDDVTFEPPPYQVEPPPPPPEYQIAHTFTYVPHEDTPEIESIVVRGEFNGWSGNAQRMTFNEAEGIWNVTVPLDAERYQYKYVFNGEGWAGNMCADDTWGNPPGGPVDPDLEECEGENGVVNVDPEGLPAHTFTYLPHAETPEIESIVVRGEFNGWSGNAMRMTEHEGVWSVTTGLSSGRYQYKYVFNGEGWAGNMCADGTWGNPPGGPVDPDVEECDGENAVLVIH